MTFQYPNPTKAFYKFTSSVCTMFVQTKDLAQEHNVYEKELFRNLTFSSQEETPLCLLSFSSSFSFKFEKGCGLKILADPKEKIRF